jgi:uncharacterized protein (DUF1015 family)
MADILPFKGILYNPKKVNRLANVITPPFDVISSKEQDQFYDSSPFNMIRLIRGKSTAYDTRVNNPHSRAADYMATWLTKRILIQDDEPAFYLTTLDFEADRQSYRRYGLIVLVPISSYDQGIILPHERTFTNIKSERLELMKACHTNFSPIFSMIPDDNKTMLEAMQQLTAQVEPDISFAAKDGCRHKLWRIVDPDAVKKFTDTIRNKKIYIADGHHRYETALNYSNWMHAKNPELPQEHPANFVMMYLSSMADPGLIIRPAHRLLREVPQLALDQLLEKARSFFEVEELSFREDQRKSALLSFVDKLKGNGEQSLIGMCMKGRNTFYRLNLINTDSLSEIIGSDLSGPLKQLDVVIMTRLLFVEYLKFDQARLDNEKLIAYSTSAQEAVNRVARGEIDVCFLLNPTTVQQVRNVADEGLIMPRKATYFYPKVTTGLVINQLFS